MRISKEHWSIQAEKQYSWHKWFAVYPVRVNPHELAWLENVYRRKVYAYDDIYWEYKK